jgi:hypothetical protein
MPSVGCLPFLTPALRSTGRANLSVGPLRHAPCFRFAPEPFFYKDTASKRREGVWLFFENGGLEIQKGRNLQPPVPKKTFLGVAVDGVNSLSAWGCRGTQRKIDS